MSKLFALENDNTEDLLPVDAVSPEESQVAEAQLETDAEVTETDALANAVDEGSDAAGDMEEVEDLVADAAENGEGLDTVAAEAVRLSVQAICKRVGADPKAVYSLYATENFSSPSARKANTQIALEGVAEFLKDMWKRLKAALSRMWEKVKAFWAKHLSSLGQVKKALESTKAKVKANSGKLKGPSFIDKAPSGLASAFAGKGDVTKKSVQEYLDAQGEISNMAVGVTKAMEALASNVSDVGSLGKAMAAFTSMVKSEDKGVLIIGGELLKIRADVDDDGKNFRLDVTRDPVEDKDEDRAMQVADKAELISMLDTTLAIIKNAEQVRKDSDKSEQAGRDALAKIEKAITADNLTPEVKDALRVNMNVLYRMSAQGAKIRGICASQNVRAAKAVIAFTNVCLKQYK